MSFTKTLCKALNFPVPDDKLKPFEYFGRCGMCGGLEGPFYHGQELCSASNAVFMEVFHGVDAPVCVYCTSLFKAQNPRTNNNGSKAMCVIGDMAGFPVIARDSAEKFQRPCWTDIAKTAPMGARCVIILSTNTKKRVWPIAIEGVIGPNTPVTISDNDLNMNETIFFDWGDMLEDLAIIEAFMDRGLVKTMLFNSLLTKLPLSDWTMEEILQAEDVMRIIREKRHAPFVHLIAQKEATV